MSTAVTYLERVATAADHADHHARLDRARRTRHQARLVADGQTLAAGPWRADHLAAVVDRNRIRQYQQEHNVGGAAEIASQIFGGAS